MTFRPLSFVTVVLGTVAVFSAATLGRQPPNEAKPGIEYKLAADGNVGLRVLDAHGNRIPIMFSEEGETNSTVVRIDGKDVEFGTEDGKWDGEATPLGKGQDGKPRRGHRWTWIYEKIAITQVVEIVPSKTGRLDACVISYEIENKDQRAHEVGIRALIDTMINENDGNAFALPGAKEAITSCADFRAGKGFPDVVKAVENDDLSNPGFVAHFTLKVGRGLGAPDRFVITHLPEDVEVWDVPIKNIDADAAVAIFWNPRPLAAGARRSVGYAYGQGIVAGAEAQKKANSRSAQ